MIGPISFDELVFQRAQVRYSDQGWRLARASANRLRRKGADRRVIPAFYVRNWQHSTLATALHQ